MTIEKAFMVTASLSWYIDEVVDADHAKAFVHDHVAADAIVPGIRYTLTATEVENGPAERDG